MKKYLCFLIILISLNIFAGFFSGSSGGGGTSKSITQSSHGFDDQLVYLNSGGSYVLADADATATSDVVGIAQNVDTNNFTLVTSGYVSGLQLTGIGNVGDALFLSETAGAFTATSPAISKFLGIKISNTEMYLDLTRTLENTEVASDADRITGDTYGEYIDFNDGGDDFIVFGGDGGASDVELLLGLDTNVTLRPVSGDMYIYDTSLADVYFFKNSTNTYKSKYVYFGSYLTTDGGVCNLGIGVSDEDDKAHITRDDTDIEGLDIDMPVTRINNTQFSYIMADSINDYLDTDLISLWAWVDGGELTTGTATTESDLGPGGHDLTYTSMEYDDIDEQYMAYVVSPSDTSEYLSASDDDDFSFTNDSTDSACSFFAWVYVANGTGNRVIASKWDETTSAEDREWTWYLTSTETMIFRCEDEANNSYIQTTINSALSVGWHSILITYDGSDADTGFTVYVDGSSVAETGATSGSYTCMINGSTDVYIGCILTTTGLPFALWENARGCISIINAELTAEQARRLHLKTRGYYGE